MPIPRKVLEILGPGTQNKNCLSANFPPGARNWLPTAWLSVVSTWYPGEEQVSALVSVRVASFEGSRNQEGGLWKQQAPFYFILSRIYNDLTIQESSPSSLSSIFSLFLPLSPPPPSLLPFAGLSPSLFLLCTLPFLPSPPFSPPPSNIVHKKEIRAFQLR